MRALTMWIPLTVLTVVICSYHGFMIWQDVTASSTKQILAAADAAGAVAHLSCSKTDKNEGYSHDTIIEPKGHFSACLITMDDHSMLDEWLAYHYFALKLRYVVVTVDPNSEMIPTALFERWRQNAPDFTIVEWKDEDFARNATAYKLDPGEEDTTPKSLKELKVDPRVLKHLNRQGEFYVACGKRMAMQKKTWTLYLDVDEFLSVNQKMLADNEHAMLQQPGHVLWYLQHLIHKRDSYVAGQGPCINVPRSLNGYRTFPNEIAHVVQEHVPVGFNVSNFNTLQFIHRSTKQWEMYDLSKSLLDVSALDPNIHFNGDGSHFNVAHQPIENVCNKLATSNFDKAPLRVHHYLGTLDTFLWRKDARRSAGRWKREGGHDHGVDDELRYWLYGFVNLVGNETAQVLLQDAGKFPNRASSSNP